MPRLNKYDPLAVTVSREEINALRDELEVAPVSVNGVLVDIDTKSEKRMEDAIALWDGLGVESLVWTMADNNPVTVNKAQLTELLAAAKIQRAMRAMQLHTEARVFKDSPGTSRRDLENWRTTTLSS